MNISTHQHSEDFHNHPSPIRKRAKAVSLWFLRRCANENKIVMTTIWEWVGPNHKSWYKLSGSSCEKNTTTILKISRNGGSRGHSTPRITNLTMWLAMACLASSGRGTSSIKPLNIICGPLPSKLAVLIKSQQASLCRKRATKYLSCRNVTTRA